MRQQVRAIYGASLSPDATAFAHIVDDGGYPRAVQRFLRGWRASSSRDVELPVEGPVTRVIHSADGYWLACQDAPEGGTPKEVVTKLNRAVNEVIADPAFVTRARAIGMEPRGGSAEDMDKFLRVEIDRWVPVVKSLNLPKS